MTLSLADGPLQMAEHPAGFEDDDDQLSGGFGRFLRLGAGVVSGFLPEKLREGGVGKALTAYAASPESRPGGGGNQGFQPAPMPQFLPAPMPQGNFPMTTAPKGILTPKNLMIGGGVLLAGVLVYSMTKKRR